MSTAFSALDDGTGRLSRRAWGALLVLCGALFLDAMDVSSTGVALPSISADLDMSTSSLQWVVSAYVLGYGGFLLLGGRAAAVRDETDPREQRRERDRYGQEEHPAPADLRQQSTEDEP